MPTRRAPPATVEAALKTDLKAFGSLATSALAAAAVALAKELDNAENSATSKSMCARALIETLDRLRALVPPEQKKDRLDGLTARRASRLARGSKAKGPVGPAV